jgi:hypothetical protein
MSVAALRKLRPRAEVAPYVGLSEPLNGDTIWYRIPDPPIRKSGTEGMFARVFGGFDSQTIEALHLHHSIGKSAGQKLDSTDLTALADSAERLWSDRARSLRKRFGGMECFAMKRRGFVKMALAKSGEIWLGAALIQSRTYPIRDGEVFFPPALHTFVTSRLEYYAPSTMTRDALICPGPFEELQNN